MPQTESSVQVPAAEADKNRRELSVPRISHTREFSMRRCVMFRKPFVCSENRA